MKTTKEERDGIWFVATHLNDGSVASARDMSAPVMPINRTTMVKVLDDIDELEVENARLKRYYEGTDPGTPGARISWIHDFAEREFGHSAVSSRPPELSIVEGVARLKSKVEPRRSAAGVGRSEAMNERDYVSERVLNVLRAAENYNHPTHPCDSEADESWLVGSARALLEDGSFFSVRAKAILAAVEEAMKECEKCEKNIQKTDCLLNISNNMGLFRCKFSSIRRAAKGES